MQTVVVARDLTAPPPAPFVPGDSYIVAPGGQGPWAGQDRAIATFDGQGWAFISPQAGWKAFVRADLQDAVFDGTAWIVHDPGLENLPGLGVGTESDATNRLAVSGPATLLTHDGADHQLKINKASASDTASLLYQSNWSGRAELGLAGSEDFTFKVSANGSLWTEALCISRSTGQISGAAVQSDPQDATAGRLVTVGGFGLGAETVALAAQEVDDLTASGLYHLSAPLPGQLGTDASLLHLQTNSTTAVQLAFDPGTDRCQWRHRTGSGWQDWHRLYHSGDVLGAVGLTADRPTGALFDRRDTANGQCLRFADGTQICTHHIDLGAITAAGAGTWATPYHTAPAAAWTYPAPFLTPPQVNRHRPGASRGTGPASGQLCHDRHSGHHQLRPRPAGPDRGRDDRRQFCHLAHSHRTLGLRHAPPPPGLHPSLTRMPLPL